MQDIINTISAESGIPADDFHVAKDHMAAYHDHRVTVLIEDIGQGVGKLLTMHNGDTEATETFVSLPEAIYQGLVAAAK